MGIRVSRIEPPSCIGLKWCLAKEAGGLLAIETDTLPKGLVRFPHHLVYSGFGFASLRVIELPHVALFFAAAFLAFIPQFIVPTAGHVGLQFLILGAVSVLLNTSADVLAVFGAGRLHARLLSRPLLFRRVRQASGGLMATLGISLLATRRA
jgi:hypothetical protein